MGKPVRSAKKCLKRKIPQKHDSWNIKRFSRNINKKWTKHLTTTE